jgi:uncharacterized protein YbjT (DUF2867 family)
MTAAAATPPTDPSSRALLAGATGLVGGICLRKLLAGAAFARTTAVARRPLPIADPRLDVIVTELDQLAITAAPPARAALCALGTTIDKAGSQAAFRRVDYDAVLAFARWARQADTATFVLVSSVGAAAASRNFYLRIKGETEDALTQLGFDRVVMLRPSLLIGPRPDRRRAEAVAQVMAPAFNPLLRGRLRIYRALPGEAVAAAMINAAIDSKPGKHVWHYDEILAAANPG